MATTKKKTSSLAIPSFARPAKPMRARPFGPSRPPELRKKPVRMTGRVKVLAERDRMGNVMLTPLNRAFAARVEKRLRENGVRGGDLESVFLSGDSVYEFAERYLPKAKRKDLDEGYAVTFLMDSWDLDHYFGYMED